MKVSFVFKHDVMAADNKRYICAQVTVHQPSSPVTALWGNISIDVWVPFPTGATMDELREAALTKAIADTAAFSKVPRETFELISGE